MALCAFDKDFETNTKKQIAEITFVGAQKKTDDTLHRFTIHRLTTISAQVVKTD